MSIEKFKIIWFFAQNKFKMIYLSILLKNFSFWSLVLKKILKLSVYKPK